VQMESVALVFVLFGFVCVCVNVCVYLGRDEFGGLGRVLPVWWFVLV
jgi:hypothetical protein